MKNRLANVFNLALVVLMVSGPVYAHHSSAAFDLEHSVSVKGTVTVFEWSNPHAFIYLDVKDEKGSDEQWRVECNSPNMLTRVGWTRGMIKAGDQLSVSGAPAKNGKKVMRLESITMANGQKFDGQGFK
jgi:Family of unknown function (DUF6152)